MERKLTRKVKQKEAKNGIGNGTFAAWATFAIICTCMIPSATAAPLFTLFTQVYSDIN